MSVLRVDLLMLARLPRASAVAPATRLLNHASLRGEAADVLAAAAEAGLLSEAQCEQIHDRVLAALDPKAPLPAVVRLLGRVGHEDDWQRLTQWLESEQGAVKQAAVQAWAESERPLHPLAKFADDAQVGPVFILAALRRGKSATTLQALAEHRPASAVQVENWQRALVAVAGRVPVDAVLETVKYLEQHDGEPALCEAMLSASLLRFEEPKSTPASKDEDAHESPATQPAATQPARVESSASQPASAHPVIAADEPVTVRTAEFSKGDAAPAPAPAPAPPPPPRPRPPPRPCPPPSYSQTPPSQTPPSRAAMTSSG